MQGLQEPELVFVQGFYQSLQQSRSPTERLAVAAQFRDRALGQYITLATTTCLVANSLGLPLNHSWKAIQSITDKTPGHERPDRRKARSLAVIASLWSPARIQHY